ncbi:hypothetical protein DVH24_034277 [Malus domestica]|uniref:Uncharacterized protein n=1 Tax=Malus domestica TaxID=3750 RepID=A0A498IYF8_MALDO|nr:hypothetical protein DVH24_034277 [Malus domestica]
MYMYGVMLVCHEWDFKHNGLKLLYSLNRHNSGWLSGSKGPNPKTLPRQHCHQTLQQLWKSIGSGHTPNALGCI